MLLNEAVFIDNSCQIWQILMQCNSIGHVVFFVTHQNLLVTLPMMQGGMQQSAVTLTFYDSSST